MENKPQCYFHTINKDVTINLAEVSSVENKIEHWEWFKKTNPDSYLGHSELESGRTCRVTMRRTCRVTMLGSILDAAGGCKFEITRDEMTKLQDALEWYNRRFVEVELSSNL